MGMAYVTSVYYLTNIYEPDAEIKAIEDILVRIRFDCNNWS